jgi:formylglycine-generating enzyme required for sulfatase activity
MTIFHILLFLLPCASPAEELPKTITGNDGAEMVLIPEGKFIMGTSDKDLIEIAPEHEVYISSFFMDKYEVTNNQFARFLNDTTLSEEGIGQRRQWVVIRSDLDFLDRASWWPTEIIYENGNYAAFSGYEKLPVLSVSWEGAHEYCLWAGKRLPTEAEWEKAARGGLEKKDYPWGNAIPTVGLIFGRRWRDNQLPAPTGGVGNYLPNGYGLFDMAGNVWEWCSDWYSPEYYKHSPLRDPEGPKFGSEKVMRGGSWFNTSLSLRAAQRNADPPGLFFDAVGFRCAKDAGGDKR